mgnify:CR=1 FL=1
MTRKNYQLGGVTCQVCVNKIEKKVGKLEGVSEIVVNLANSRGKVIYDSEKIKLSEILEVIKKLGYDGKKHEELEEDSRALENEKILKRKFLEFKLAIFFSAIVFYISMGTMVGLPVPNIISPDNNPLNFALIQLVLALSLIHI